MKAIKYEDLLRDELRDEVFKREYESLEDEFSLAQEIIALRKENHLTQKELADRTGTSQPAIARVESGNYRNISLSFLRRIADALDAKPEIHLKKKA